MIPRISAFSPDLPDREETEHYFHRALMDVGIPQRPVRKECLFQYCGDVAREVLRGSIPPLSTLGPLFSIAIELN
ncbi:MAG: hypothetical protein IPK15_15305 [Verrucomicrobia bacterium]|nr:hypothetical protein [Verrucomicrobiota bacterium]